MTAIARTAEPLSAQWKYCWLCNQPLPTGFADRPPPATRRAEGALGLLSVASRMIGATVGAGLTLIGFSLAAQGEYGGVLMLLILLVPPTVYTLVRILDARAQNKAPQTMLHHAGVFLSSLAVTLLTLALIAIALLIALVVACLSILSVAQSG